MNKVVIFLAWKHTKTWTWKCVKNKICTTNLTPICLEKELIQKVNCMFQLNTCTVISGWKENFHNCWLLTDSSLKRQFFAVRSHQISCLLTPLNILKAGKVRRGFKWQQSALDYLFLPSILTDFDFKFKSTISMTCQIR